ncbi:MAG: DUF262 domain-containing protein [Candidatus Zixiibacteriota bacterium]
MGTNDNFPDEELLSEDEQEDLEIAPDKRTIYSEQGDPEVDSLYNKYKRGKLVVQSDFQRRFVWDRTKASRLMESALIDVPLPVVYLSQETDGKEYVIDGQQRLTSFFSFIDGKFPDGKNFVLTSLKVYSELVGKSYAELSEELQDKIRFCKIRTITFRKESQPDLKFEIFERLNTGAMPLNDQELRNCIYRGPYNDLLKELSRDPDYVSLMGFVKPDKRMKDVEFVLRFAAFFHATYLHYKPSMGRFLNEDMRKYQNLSADASSELRFAFRNAVALVKSVFGDRAFKRFYPGSESNPNGFWEPQRFNASLYDVLMYTFAREDKNKVMQNLDSVREALIYLMTTDQKFIDAIELGTSGTQSVVVRFDSWRQTLQHVIGINRKEPRSFSMSIKHQLFDSDCICAICGQQVSLIDDAEIDHTEQYWRGGQTIPENARLTHRYCNRARSRHDGERDTTIVIRSQRSKSRTDVTPREAYRPLILDALVRLGGAAKQAEVFALIEQSMANQFTNDDLTVNKDGYTTKWKNLAAFERLNMVKDGVLRDDSSWGIWEITAKGREIWRELQAGESH